MSKESMKIKLVLHDWVDKNLRSVYSTQEGLRLSSGELHSGTTFDGTIECDAETAEDICAAAKRGYRPVFWVMDK